MAGFDDAGSGGGWSGTNTTPDNTDPALLVEIAAPDGADLLEFDTSTGAEKIILAGGGARVGIGGQPSANTSLHIQGTAPRLRLHNTTEENGSGGRESRIEFYGEQDGAEITSLGFVEISHSGTSDDEQGQFLLKLNDGNDGASPSVTVLSAFPTYFEPGVKTLSGYTGSAGAPAYSFSADNNTGMWREGTDILGLATAGTARFLIDATGKITTGGETVSMSDHGGSLHIYTGNSGQTDITGNADNLIIEGSANSGLSIASPHTSQAQIAFTANGVNNDRGAITYVHHGHSDGETMSFRVNDSVRATIDSAGKLGISLTAPDALLHVQDTAISTTRPTFNADTVAIFENDVNCSIQILTKDAASSIAEINMGGTGEDREGNLRYIPSEQKMEIGPRNASSHMGLYTANTQRFYIDASGKLATGGETTSLAASGGSIHVKTGDSAATSSDVHADADDLIVEGSGNTGISILTPTNGKGCLYFIDENTGGTPDGIAFDQGTGSLRFQVANSERVRIDNGGKVGVGASPAHLMHVQDGDLGIVTNSADTVGKSLIFTKSRNATDGSHTIVADDDVLGQIEFQGSDGNSFALASRIYSRVDGTPGDGDMPGAIVFATSADGAEATTDRMTINAAGQVLIGSPTTARTLAVAGEFRVEADGVNDFFQVTNMSGAGSAGINGISQGDINFKLKSSNAYFGVLNDSGTLFSVNQNGKISTGGEAGTTALCAAGGIHILGPGGAGSRSSVNAGSSQLVIEDDGTDGCGITIIGNNSYQTSIDFYTASGDAGRLIWQQSIDAFRFFTANKEPLRLYPDGVSIFTDATPTATFEIKGTLTEALSSGTVSTSGSSTTLNGSSTAFLTDFAIGSAIKVGSVTTTVTAIADDTTLTLEDAIETGVTGTACTRDGSLVKVQSGDSKTRFEFDSLGQLTLCDTAHTSIMVTDGDITTMSGTNNTIIGAEPLATMTTNNNTRVGQRAGRGSTGVSTTMVGAQCGEGASTGTEVTLFGYHAGNAGPGSHTVGIGPRALSSCVDGSGGGMRNTSLGHRSGETLTSGNDCVFVGNTSDGAATASNQIAIGKSAVATIANEAVIGNAEVAAIRPMSAGQCLIGRAGFEVSGMVGYGGGVLMGRAAAVSSINQDGKILAQVFASSASPLTIPANSYVTRMGITSTSNADSNAYSVTLNTGTATGESALGALTGSVERIGAGEADSRTSASTGSAADLAVAATSSHTKVTGITTDGFWTGANDLYVYVMTAGTGNANTGSGLNFKFGVYVEYIGMD